MRLRNKAVLLLASLAMAGGVVAASGASSPAQAAYSPPGINGAVPVSTQLSQVVSAVDPAAFTTTAYSVTGICTSSGGGCWRNNSNALDYWPRDISGDPNQQFDVTYWGQAPGADNGACSQFSNIGVFTFVSPADGDKFEGAATLSGGIYYAGGQSSNNRYSNWAWQSSGALINCGDSQNGARFALITTGAFYHQLYTANTGSGTAWSQVHV